MNRFTLPALLSIMALQLAGSSPTALAQPLDPGDIPISAPSGAADAIGGQGSGNQMDSNPQGGDPSALPDPSRDSNSSGLSLDPALSSPDGGLSLDPPDGGPGFGGLNNPDGSPPQRQSASNNPAAPQGTNQAAASAEVRAIDDELIRIDLDLKDLESDIRTYQALLQTARDQNEANSIRQTLFAYDAQRRALTAQARQLQAARRTSAARSGSTGPGSPDPSIASRALAGETNRRLKSPGAGENPLSPESITGNTIRDVSGAVDVLRDQELQKFIESIEDPDLKERVYTLYSATRSDKTMQKSMDDLMVAIKAAGGKKATLASVQGQLEKAEAEAMRKGVDSDKLMALFMAKAGVDAIPLKEHAGYVKAMEDFDKKNNDPAKKLVPELAKKLEQAKIDYVAYKNAEAGYLQQNQADPKLLKKAEEAFQKHLKSLKLFLKTLDETTDQGRKPEGVFAKATPDVAPPSLATRQTQGTELAVPGAPSDTTSTSPSAAATPAAPAAPEAASTATPPAVSTANKEALAKVAAALKSFNEGVEAKLAEVDARIVTAWPKDRHWYAGWFGSDPDPRIKELSDLSKYFFAYNSTDKTGNVFQIWPAQLQRLSADAQSAGIDITTEPSIKAAGIKARESVLGTMLLARLLKGYDGHLATIEDASDLAEVERQLYIDRKAQPMKFKLDEFRSGVSKDSSSIRLGIEGLWTSASLGEARALLTDSMKAQPASDSASKLEDLRVQFHHYQERMSRGYISTAGGFRHWMNVTDSPVYRLIELVNHYLEAKAYFEAKLVLDELK